MKTIYRVWDEAIGANLVFETRKEAKEYADNINEEEYSASIAEVVKTQMTKKEFDKLKEFNG